MIRVIEFVIEKVYGVKFWIVDGKEYIDFVLGVVVNVVGYMYEKMVEVIKK